MDVEEALHRRINEVAERLKEDVVRHFAEAVDELAAMVDAERAAAAADAAQVARDAAIQENDDRVTSAAAAAEAQRLARDAAEFSAGVRLADAIRAIDSAGSLSEILEALISAAQHEAERVALLLVEEERLRVWRFLPSELSAAPTRDDELPVEQAGVITTAVRTAVLATAESADVSPVPSFPGMSEGRDPIALPIIVGGRVVSVLYADKGPEGEPSDDLAATWTTRLEVLTRHAARALEAMTALRTAQLVHEQARMTSANRSPNSEAEQSDEEQAARRYARLLVSEIKLYHEDEVALGRRERDLAARLGGEIARARALYEQRIPVHVRVRFDLFESELVRTLANGDPSLLGPVRVAD